MTDFSVTIAGLYDAAVDPTRWTLALKGVCAFVGGAQATMFWQGLTANEVGAFHHYNDDPHYTQLILNRMAPLNPVYPAVLFQDVGAVHTFSDLVPDEEMHETLFYREWVAPQRFTDALSVLLERNADRVTVLTFPWRGGAIGSDARERLALLVPHIQRAVEIGRLFVRHQAKTATMTETLDHVGEPVFLLTGAGRIVFANAGARAMVERGCLLQEGSDRLRGVSAEADRSLLAGLRAIEDAVSTRAGTTFTLEVAPQERLTAHLLPLADGARREIGQAHRASAALFVRHSRFSDPPPLETLARRYGLTASEIRVVEASLRFSGLDAIAAGLGIAKATVKTHLNRIYRKCAVKNQSSLIKLVAGLGQG